jgi:hypothetical protein
VTRVSRIRASRLARGQAATMCGLLILTFGLDSPSMAQPGTQPPDIAAWARCKETPTCRCVLRHALEVAKTPKGGDNFLNLFMIAAAQADAGLAQDASVTVDLLGLAASTSLDVGVVVARIKAIVARTEADAGKLEDAMSIASAIDEPRIRGVTIGSIAIGEGKAGSIDSALKRVQSVQDDEERALAIRRAAWGLRFVATQRGEDGKIAEALRQSQSIDVRLYGSAVTDLIPQIPYITGFPQQSTIWLSAPALQIIVEAQIRAGKVVEAMQAVRSVEPAAASYWARETGRRAERFDRARVFAAIVKYLAGAGRVSEALRLALELGDPLVLDNPFVLDSFAWDRFEERIVVAPRRSRGYADVGDDRQPEMRAGPQGKVDPEALAVARSFPAEGRAAALHMVAEVLARAGEPSRAAEAAQLIDEPRHRIGALIAVGLAQAGAGSQAAAQAAFGEAEQIAQSFGDDLPIPRTAKHNVRSTVLAYIATAYARAGMTAEALRTARLAGEEGYLYDDRLVSDLVHALAEGGHANEAIRTAGLLGHQNQQDLILGDAAVSLARAGYGAAALQVERAMLENSARVAALAEIARALRRAGADGDAATAIRRAMSAVAPESIEELVSLSRALPD